MRESLETYVACPTNQEAVQAINAMNGGLPTHLIIEGPRHSGKTTLARALAGDTERNGAELMVFVCSGADVALALLDETNDDFLERLGSTPIIVIDDIAPLQRAEKGDQLLGLLLDERQRLGLSTAFIVDGTVADYDMPDFAEKTADFSTVAMAPLDDAGKAAFVRMALDHYGTDKSPQLADDAIRFIAEELPGQLPDKENAIHYLMVDEDCAKLGAIDAETARQLLTA